MSRGFRDFRKSLKPSKRKARIDLRTIQGMENVDGVEKELK